MSNKLWDWLDREYLSIESNPTYTADEKVQHLIYVTAGICGVVAMQPLPFADIVALTPMQCYMATKIGRIRGFEISEQNALPLLKGVAGTVGRGFIAQQTVIGLYKIGVPFLGGLMTFPLVSGLTCGIGRAMDLYFRMKARGLSASSAELKRAYNAGKSEGRNIPRPSAINGWERNGQDKSQPISSRTYTRAAEPNVGSRRVGMAMVVILVLASVGAVGYFSFEMGLGSKPPVHTSAPIYRTPHSAQATRPPVIAPPSPPDEPPHQVTGGNAALSSEPVKETQTSRSPDSQYPSNTNNNKVLPDAKVTPGVEVASANPQSGPPKSSMQSLDGLVPAVIAYHPEPEYPSKGRKKGIQGKVVLWIHIDSTGKVKKVKVLESPGRGFRKHSVKAVKTWRFRPATKDGFPVPSELMVQVNFSFTNGVTSVP